MTEPNIEPRSSHTATSGVSTQVQKQLLEKLERFRGHKPLIIAASTEAFPLARFLADELEGDADVLAVRRLTDPRDESVAVGTVSEWGAVYLNSVAQSRGITMNDVREQVIKKIEAMRMQADRDENSSLSPENRLVIMVDLKSVSGDRLAAAISSTKTLIPKKLVLALPSMTHRAFALLNNQCDEIIALAVE